MVQTCDQARAAWKVALFVILVAMFSVIVGILQSRVPSGARLILISWSPFVADASKMWSVGIAGLISLLVVDHSFRDLGLRFCRLRYLTIAIAVPSLYCLAIYLPVWVSGLAEFRGGEFFLMRLFLAALHFPLNLLLATGEEIGWRGVLVPNLARTSGFTMAALLPGVAWAVWHWPDIIFFGYNENISIVYALCCFSISVVGLGVFLTWLRLASDSLWPPILFHGAHNTLISGVFEASTKNGRLTAYFTTEFGIGLSAVAMVLGYVCWTNRATAECPTRTPGHRVDPL